MPLPQDSQPLRTKLSTVLLALLAHLRDQLDFPPERVLLLADDKLRFPTQADQLILVRAKGQRWETASAVGSRFDCRVRRRTTVTLRTRLALDEVTQDLQWATNQSFGHYDVEHQLFDALQLWQAPDADSNLLLYEPVHLEEATQSEKPPEASGWGQASYSFDLCFVLDLDQSIQ